MSLPPIFTFKPRTDVDVIETWQSPTSIQRSYSGNEKRQCLSNGMPTMTYEFDLITNDFADTWALEAFIRENIGKPVMLPLWWWAFLIPDALSPGDITVTLEPDGWALPLSPFYELNNPYCYIVGGGNAEVGRADWWYTVVTLLVGVVNAYPAGSLVMPLKRVLMENAIVRSRPSPEVLEAHFKFVDANSPEDPL